MTTAEQDIISFDKSFLKDNTFNTAPTWYDQIKQVFRWSLQPSKIEHSTQILFKQNVYTVLEGRINNFSNLPVSDWFKVIPNEFSILKAVEILGIFKDINKIPENISASQEGSILFNFFKGKIFYIVEVYNSGEIVYLKQKPNEDSEVHEVNGLIELKKILNEEFNAIHHVTIKPYWQYFTQTAIG